MESVLQPEFTLSIAGQTTGELADFESIVRQHQSVIFRYILASLRDRDAAETLTQECFLKAYQARGGFRGEASVKTWLMRIAVNLVRDHISNVRLKFWRRTQRASIDLSLAGDWLSDGKSSPEAAANARQQVAAIWSAVDGLSEKQRTVFLLRFVEEMDILEIVAATGIKEGTVKVHLFRALQAVRAKIAGGKQ